MNQNENDPRKGLTSASNALYDTLCPGRHQAQKAAPPQEADENEDAAIGTRLHHIYAGTLPPDADPASEDEMKIIEAARATDQKAKADWSWTLEDGAPRPLEPFREQRVWVLDDQGKPIHSGQPDLVLISGTQGGACDILIGDLKSLWGDHDPSDINFQLRDYAALFYLSISQLGFSSVTSVTVYINQPARPKEFKLTRYGTIELMLAASEMLHRINVSNSPGGPRLPGATQCKYCRAKLACPEFLKTVVVDVPMEITKMQAPEKEHIENAVALMPNEKLNTLLHYRAMLDQCSAALKAEGKRRIKEDAASLPDWELTPGVDRRTITDVQKVFQRCVAVGVGGEEFTKECGVAIGAVEKMVKSHTNEKGDALKLRMASILDGAIEVKRCESKLEARR